MYRAILSDNEWYDIILDDYLAFKLRGTDNNKHTTLYHETSEAFLPIEFMYEFLNGINPPPIVLGTGWIIENGITKTEKFCNMPLNSMLHIINMS